MNPVGYSPWGHKELDITEHTHMHNNTEKEESAKKRNDPRMGVKWPRNICSQLGL